MARATKLPMRYLQEYLENVATAHSELAGSKLCNCLLQSFAELRFQLHGGARCSMCKAHVRHVIPVRIMKDDEWHRYSCLCARCFEGERALSHLSVMQIGDALVEYRAPGYEGPSDPRRKPRTSTPTLT